MDTATINHVSLCSGYGGIDLGLSRAMGRSLRTIAYSEIEAFACANLVSKMEAGWLDPAPIWSDLKTFPWQEFHGLVDILSGGYPCQPFSAAGKRAGKDDPRHLWPWIADGIRIARPRLCFFENVEGHISLGLSTVISDLEELGYRTTFGVFSAAEVGAPHQRKRVFILAHDQRQRIEELVGKVAGHAEHATARDGGAWPSRPGEPQHGWEPPRVVGHASQCHGVDAPRVRRALERQTGWRESGNTSVEEGWEPPRVVENAAIIGRRGRCDGDERGSGWKVQAQGPCSARGENLGDANGSRQQERERERGSAIQGTHADGGAATEWQTQPALGGNPNGSAHRLDHAELYVTSDNRTDELRLLGNGVVPATAERAFRVLWAELQASG